MNLIPECEIWNLCQNQCHVSPDSLGSIRSPQPFVHGQAWPPLPTFHLNTSGCLSFFNDEVQALTWPPPHLLRQKNLSNSSVCFGLWRLWTWDLASLETIRRVHRWQQIRRSKAVRWALTSEQQAMTRRSQLPSCLPSMRSSPWGNWFRMVCLEIGCILFQLWPS